MIMTISSPEQCLFIKQHMFMETELVCVYTVTVGEIVMQKKYD